MTKRERDLLAFICTFIEDRGKAPTYAEMAAGIGVKSRGNAHRLVRKLADQGYITFEPNSFRSIEVIDAKAAALWEAP